MRIEQEMGIAKLSARRTIRRLVNRYLMQGEWTSYHWRISSELMQAWMRGVAESELEDWLLKRCGFDRLPPSPPPRRRREGVGASSPLKAAAPQ